MNKSSGISGGVIVLLVIVAIVAWSIHDAPNDDRREKFLTCWNNYVDQSRAAATFWKNYTTTKTDEEKRAQLARCREAWGRIKPFEPIGVDPQLADAIAGVKKAWIERLDFEIQQVGVWWPDQDRATKLYESVASAQQQLDSQCNRVASEFPEVEAINRK